MTKPRQAPEIAFENREWNVRARVIHSRGKPGYDVLIEPTTNPPPPAHHCKSLREAVIKAMDIAGVQ